MGFIHGLKPEIPEGQGILSDEPQTTKLMTLSGGNPRGQVYVRGRSGKLNYERTSPREQCFLEEGMNTITPYYIDSKVPTKKQAGLVWNEIVAFALFKFGSLKFLALRSWQSCSKTLNGSAACMRIASSGKPHARYLQESFCFPKGVWAFRDSLRRPAGV